MNENLPLTEATFFILLSLASGGKHGYAIMQDAASLSAGRVTLSTGTLYGALKRLLEQGWITRIDEDEPDTDGRPRKVYELTGEGRRILHAETHRLQHVVEIARGQLEGSEL